MQHLITRAGIESNKAFQRLIDKTQVLNRNVEMNDIFRNRLTHSYEVATSAEIIVASISTKAFNVDYQNSVYNVSLLHDIGHSPFGHEGAAILDSYFKDIGISDGFSDNNNNLIVIEKDQIKISEYETASLIKYPSKLYKNQIEYKEFLNKAIDSDIEYFKDKIKISQRPKRTISCNIMDEADRNTYICTDLTDAYSMGILKEPKLEELLNSEVYNSVEIINFLSSAIFAIKQNNKTLIKKAFNELKIEFNQNYYLGENLTLKPKNQELYDFREYLYKIDLNDYIRSDYIQEIKKQDSEFLKKFISLVINYDVYPSKFYTKKIKNANNVKEKFTLIRDMIANTTANFIRQTVIENQKNAETKN